MPSFPADAALRRVNSNKTKVLWLQLHDAFLRKNLNLSDLDFPMAGIFFRERYGPQHS
jgi:hypothetical protein